MGVKIYRKMIWNHHLVYQVSLKYQPKQCTQGPGHIPKKIPTLDFTPQRRRWLQKWMGFFGCPQATHISLGKWAMPKGSLIVLQASVFQVRTVSFNGGYITPPAFLEWRARWFLGTSPDSESFLLDDNHNHYTNDLGPQRWKLSTVAWIFQRVLNGW